MIYNNLEFMGVPFDVLIKQFRDSEQCVSFANVRGAADAFFDYLKYIIGAPQELQNNHVSVLIVPVFQRVARRFERDARRAIARVPNGRRRSTPDFHKIFLDTLQAEIGRIEEVDPSECFQNIGIDFFVDRYNEVFDRSIKDVFSDFPIDDDDKGLLRKLAAVVLHRDEYSEMLTGLVFAGFGNDEMFPSLLSFED